MTTSLVPAAEHAPLDRRIVLSGLWISMLFVFAYVDIFAFWRADVIDGAIYALTIVGSMVGETWAYYLVGSGVELVLLASIIRVALRWR